tara:strand:+ start:196 stop:621 length:426 start_codon:yes stop_codon:yes gene_type:complete
MFVNIDNSQLPLIKINFGEKINTYSDLDPFFNIWLSMYQEKKNFSFLLNTSSCGCIPIKYSYEMAKRISKIKKLETHYLQRTIVIIKSKWIKKLMCVLFKIVKPVAPVYIVKDEETFETLYFRLQNNMLKSDLDYDFLDSK